MSHLQLDLQGLGLVILVFRDLRVQVWALGFRAHREIGKKSLEFGGNMRAQSSLKLASPCNAQCPLRV